MTGEEHIHGAEDMLMLAVFCLIGWLVRIAIDYALYSRKVEKSGGRFNRKEFVRKYDQDWVLGLVVVFAISAGGDYLWAYWLGPLLVKYNAVDVVAPFDHRLGILFGLFSTELGMFVGFIVSKIRRIFGNGE